MTEGGLIKRVPTSSFRTQRRKGKGVKTQDDITSTVIRTNTIDSLMIFTDQGKMYRLLVDNIPVGTNTTQGTPVRSLVEMDNDEKPVIIYSIYRDTDAKFVLFVTKNGLVKKTALEEYIKTKKRTGMPAINLREGDELASVFLIKDESVILATANGLMIKFNSSQITSTSRNTSGVKGINLGEEDYVVAGLPVRNNTDDLAVFISNGYAKRIASKDLISQNRGGKGVVCYKDGSNNNKVADIALVCDEDRILISGDKSSICISAEELPQLSRTSLGNMVIKNNKIISVTKV
jgi:DNA gyrase subunit A